MAALADDTGLFVDALNGDPGIYAARYAGEGCTYSDNVQKLLLALKDVPDDKRQASFRTAITIRYPGGAVDQMLGEVKGSIEKLPKGDGGFGYDPIFRPEGSRKVFSEMALSEKNAISHRGRALKKAAELLKRKS
jgi:XTP/dITP diphosphohydrolase